MKHLERTSKGKVLGGVCSGLGKYFDIDPVIIRLLWALTVIWGGFGIIVYLVCWIIIPEEKVIFPCYEPEKTEPEESETEESESEETS